MKTMEVVENVIRYEAPQVRIIEVEVEKGFAISDEVGGGVDDMPIC